MYARYGSYQHANNEVSLTKVSRDGIQGQGGQLTGYRRGYVFRGVLHADTVGALTTAILALEAAYSTNGLDWALYETGGTITAHSLLSADSFGGVRVLSFNWFDGPGEYTTYRTYEIALEAEYQFGGGVNFSQWSETVIFEGTGGPIRRFIPVLNGPWQEQIVSQRSTFRATQSGNIVAIFGPPNYPPPLWPDKEHVEQRRISTNGPVFDGSRYSNFGVSWDYSFESNDPLVGSPNRQPG